MQLASRKDGEFSSVFVKGHAAFARTPAPGPGLAGG